MKKSKVLTSVVASSVLAGVLVMSGCGGSGSSSKEPGGLKAGESAKAKVQVGKNSTADVKTGDGKLASSVTFSNIVANDGKSPRCAETNSCEVIIQQDTSCPDAKVAEEDAVLRYTKCYGKTATAYASRKGIYNYETEMIVYGGALLFKSDDFDGFSAELKVKGLACGLEARTEVAAGFANPGHKVFALIKVLDECGNDISDDQFTEIATMDESGNFTLNLENIDLGDDNQVEILLFSIKDADKSGSTGSTGGDGY